MPDDKTLTPPGIDKLTKGGINAETGRSKKINSLSNTINKAVQHQDKNRTNISNQIDSMRQQNLQNMKDFDINSQDFTTQTAAGYNKVLKGLGDTIQSLSMGVRNITAGTAKAGADLVKQYGKAISEDISVNKQNTVVMALAKTTPLFGYFAAKFMETDVFKNAASRMKESISKGLSGVGEFLTQDINIFKKKGRIESAQSGGLVTKGGVVKVHAAEIIAPVDKVTDMVKGIAESKLVKTLDRVVLSLDATLGKFRESIAAAGGGGKPGAPKGPFRTFMTAYAKRDNEFRLPWQERVADELTRIRVASSGLVSKMHDAWIRTLAEHPGLRGLIGMGKLFRGAFKIASGLLFWTPSGKYAKDIAKATKPKSAFDKTVNILSLMYTKTQPKLDLMLHHLRILSKAEDPKRKRGMFERTLKGYGGALGAIISAPFKLAGALGRMGPQWKLPFGIGGSEARAIRTKPSRGRTGQKSSREISIGRLKMEKKRVKMDARRNKILRGIRKGINMKNIMGLLMTGIATGISFLKDSLMTALKMITKPLSALAKLGGIKGLTGAALGILGSAAIGVAIGTLLNKYIVNPLMDKFYKRLDAIDQKTSKRMGMTQARLQELRKSGTPEQKKMASEALKMATGISAVTMQRRKDIGWKGRLSIGAIEDSQRLYMMANIGEYMKYGRSQVDAIRGKWLKTYGGMHMGLLDNPETYGKKREEAFLKYLIAHGTPLHIEETRAGVPTSASDISTIDARARANMTNEQRKAFDRQTKELAGASQEGAITIAESNTNLVASHSNQVNSTGGGGMGGLTASHTASSGNNSVDKVTFVNVDQ